MTTNQPVDLNLAKKIVACLPFADNDRGLPETEQMMRSMIAEIESLRAQLSEAEKQIADLKRERDLWRAEALAMWELCKKEYEKEEWFARKAALTKAAEDATDARRKEGLT